MPTLAGFMESLTEEQDKLVQMETIKESKDKFLAMGVLNASKGKQKEKNSKQSKKRKLDKAKTTNGGSNPPQDKDKNGKKKSKCTYFHKGWNQNSSCKNTITDHMS